MSFMKTLGSMWLAKRFPMIAAAGFIYSMFRSRKHSPAHVRR